MEDKNCGACRRCRQDTRESQVSDQDVGKEEFTCKTCQKRTVDQLMAILDRVYRFPHNVNLTDPVGEVYGRTDTNKSYLRSKVELIDRKGFTWWYHELDLPNQRKVVGIMLDRYGMSLAELVNLENV